MANKELIKVYQCQSITLNLHGLLSLQDADILACSGRNSTSLGAQLENMQFLIQLVQSLVDW